MGGHGGYDVQRVGALAQQGWTRGEIASAVRPQEVRGARVLGQPRVHHPRDARIHEAIVVAPRASVLSGWAAAALWGVPPDFLDGTRDGTTTLPVEFAVPRAEGTFERSGIRVRHSGVPRLEVAELGGARLTCPDRTALDLARWARTEGRALAMLDLCFRHGLIAPQDFAAYLSRKRRLHGLPRVRSVAPEMSDRAESVPESELRWLWLASGMRRPLVNAEVHDRFGRFVARVDILDPVSGVAAEYQGHPHRLDGAAQADAARFARFEAMNLSVVAVWKDDLRDGTAVQLLRRAGRRAAGRDRRLDAWNCPQAS